MSTSQTQILSESLRSIQPSATTSIAQKARELRAAGREVISLSAGEPDFNTPSNVCDAAIAAIMRGETRYTNTDGIPELKKAIRQKFERENDLEYGSNEVIVVPGAKFGIAAALMATLNAGDEVIFPAPYWVSYPDMTRISGGVPVPVETSAETDFLLSAQQLEQAITPRTRWLILNSPSNPSGAVYSADHIAELIAVLERHPHVWLMTDDIYEHIVYDGLQYVSPATVAKHSIADRVMVINGVSKAYAMTGWRLGYCAGPEPLIKGLSKLQSQLASHACSIAQWASVEALNGPNDFIHDRRAIFQHRRDIVVQALNDSNGISCAVPAGAFYVYPTCRELIGRVTEAGTLIDSDITLAKAILEEAEVAVVPGTAFGLANHFRVSYATSTELLDEACARIQRFCKATSSA